MASSLGRTSRPVSSYRPARAAVGAPFSSRTTSSIAASTSAAWARSITRTSAEAITSTVGSPGTPAEVGRGSPQQHVAPARPPAREPCSLQPHRHRCPPILAGRHVDPPLVLRREVGVVADQERGRGRPVDHELKLDGRVDVEDRVDVERDEPAHQARSPVDRSRPAPAPRSSRSTRTRRRTACRPPGGSPERASRPYGSPGGRARCGRTGLSGRTSDVAMPARSVRALAVLHGSAPEWRSGHGLPRPPGPGVSSP